MKIGSILKSVLKGLVDATPLVGNVAKAVKDFKDKENPSANLVYVTSFFLMLVLIFSFLKGLIDFDTLKDLIKLID